MGYVRSVSTANVQEVPKLPFQLQASERVVEMRRRHWWFLWPHTVVLALTAILPPLILLWFLQLLNLDDNLSTIFPIVAGLWILGWGIKAALNWYVYQNDIWVVTNQRLIDSYKKNPFNHRVATADLVNVTDLSTYKQGILATTLNFGDVLCETAGASIGTFRISGVPDPQSLQLLIDAERDRERTGGRAGTGLPGTPYTPPPPPPQAPAAG
jgi:hypothetical protein